MTFLGVAAVALAVTLYGLVFFALGVIVGVCLPVEEE